MTNSAGEISVDLRLKLDKLKQDVQKAASSVKDGLSKSMSFTARGGDLQRVAQGFKALRDHTEAASKAIQRTATGLRVIQSGRMAGFVAGAQIRNTAGYRSSYRSGPGAFVGPVMGNTTATAQTIQQAVKAATTRAIPPQLWQSASRFRVMAAAQLQPYAQPKFMQNQGFFKPSKEDKSRFWREMTTTIGPVANPGGLFTNIIASRQVFSAFSGTRTGAAMMGKFGLAGMGGAGIATGGVLLALNAVGYALKGFEALIRGAGNAIKSAFELNTGAAQAGLNRRFYFQRQATASILGVQGNPNQAFALGPAAAQVQQRIAASSAVISKNAPVLAQFEMNMRVLGVDMEALFSSIAAKVVPALTIFIAALDVLAKKLTQHAMTIGKVLVAALGYAAGPLLGAALKAVMANVGDSSKFFSQSANLNPTMRQLPASTMERMGLVIGGAVGGDQMVSLTRQIAKNTDETYKALKASRRNSGYYMDQNPMVAAP